MQRLLCPTEASGGEDKHGGTMRAEPKKETSGYIIIGLRGCVCLVALVAPGFRELLAR